MATNDLTADRVRELLAYSPDTGIFTRRISLSPRSHVGKQAGSRSSSGYLQIRVDSTRYLAHRLAWLHTFGVWPNGVIDHINGVKNDNRLANLRDVAPYVNSQNQKIAQSRNMSGLLGAHYQARSDRYLAHIVVDGTKKHLGSFETAEQAHAAYIEAKRRLHEGCTI
jgi:hypothetical protein